MADYQQNFLASLQGGLNFGQQIKAQRDNSALNQLAGQAYAAPQEQRQALIGQAMRIDRRAGAQLEQQAISSDEQRDRTMVNMAKLLTSAPEQARAQLWQRFIPTLSQYGMSELPQEYNAQTAPIINQAAQSLVQAYAGNGTVQSQKVGEDGFIYNTFRDGRIVNTGVKADRQMWLRDNPGMPPELVGKDQIARPVVTGGAAPAPTRSDMEADISLANAMIAAGIPDTQVDAFLASRGSRGGSAPAPATTALARPSAAQDAAAVQAAKNDVDNSNFPARLNQEQQLQNVRTQGAITQAAGTAAAEAEAKDASQRPKRIQQYRQALTAAGNVETSLDKALGLLSPYSTGFVGARSRSIEGSPSYNLASELETIKANLGFDRLQQMRDSSPTGGALGAIAVQELVALQSTIANLDPNQSEEQIRANLDRVKTHYKNWRSAVQQSLADEERAQKAQPASAPSGRSIARRGRAPDGRTVIQYSDGTIEYGN